MAEKQRGAEEIEQMKFYDSESKLVNLSDIRLGYNPRSSLGDLSSLKQSIQQIGLLDSITLRPNGHKKDARPYELVCGHRRYKAFEELKYLQIPSNIRQLSDEDTFHISFIDNKERENYNPIDEARHYKHIQDIYGKDKYSTRELAKKYGNTYDYYQRKLRLLELPNDIIIKLTERSVNLTESHAFLIAKLVDKKDLVKRFETLYNQTQDKWTSEQVERFEQELKRRQDLQISLGKRITSDDLTVRQTERQAKNLLKDIEEWNQQLDKEIEEEQKKQQLLDGIYFKDSSNMKEISDNNIDLVFTSPPYFTDKEYDVKSFDTHIQNLYSVLDECARVVSHGGKIVYNIADIVSFSKHTKEHWPEEKMVIPYLINHLREKNFVLFARIIWVKDDPWVNSSHVTTHAESKHGEYRVLPSWEYVFVFKNMNGKPKQRKQSEEIQSKLTKDEWKEYVTGVWNIRSVSSNRDHPSTFPEELAKRVIKMYSYEGDNVLDPYLGSGTTVKVARELNRNGFGYELNEQYKEVVLKKLGGNNT